MAVFFVVAPNAEAQETIRSAEGRIRQFVNVSDFGAVGDGISNDLSAIQAAFAMAKKSGRGLRLDSGKVYYINTDELPRGANILDYDGASGLTFDGAGSTMLTGRTANRTVLFRLTNCKKIKIQNVRLLSRYQLLDSKSGQDWGVLSDGASKIEFEDVEMINGRLGIAVVGFEQVKRVKSITALNVKFSGVYYPQNFAGNGDGYFARGIITRNCGRSYFPWNVKDHDVQMNSQQGGPFSDVLLKVYAVPGRYSKLENIKLDYESDGRYLGAGPQRPEEATVAVDLQQASSISALAEITGIDIKIRSRYLPIDTNSNFFIIRKYSALGKGDSSPRGYKVKDVALSGFVIDAENLTQKEREFYSKANGSSWDGEDIEAVMVKDLVFSVSHTTRKGEVTSKGVRR